MQGLTAHVACKCPECKQQQQQEADFQPAASCEPPCILSGVSQQKQWLAAQQFPIRKLMSIK